MDHDAYRKESRASWGAAASGWKARSERLRQFTMPVTSWMVDAIHPQPGHRVLELAAGTGDVGFLAAELIAPGGELISSDFSPEMLTVAQERAEKLGLPNVRFKQIDAESIDLDAASLDGVLCRWGFMLMADPEAALRETRRVLRPGGRIALAAWADPAANPWNTIAVEELAARGLLEQVVADGPGPFAFAAEGVIAELLRDAGYVDDIEVEALDFTYDYADADDWWATMLDMSQRMGGALAGADDATVAEIRAAVAERGAPYTAADGSISLPARTWVAAATA